MHVQIKRGEVFISDTDTEVIPKLCNYVYKSTQEKLSFNEVQTAAPHSPPMFSVARCLYFWPPNASEARVLNVVKFVRMHVQLVLEVISKLEGAYGLLFKSAYFPGELVACKRGSPLLLGIKEAEALRPLQSSPMRRPNPGDSFEAFIASDASAFVEHTKQ